MTVSTKIDVGEDKEAIVINLSGFIAVTAVPGDRVDFAIDAVIISR